MVRTSVSEQKLSGEIKACTKEGRVVSGRKSQYIVLRELSGLHCGDAMSISLKDINHGLQGSVARRGWPYDALQEDTRTMSLPDPFYSVDSETDLPSSHMTAHFKAVRPSKSGFRHGIGKTCQ